MEEFILTQEDHDCTIHVDLGDTIKIILTENPNTGYCWDIDGSVPEELSLNDSSYKLTHKKTLGGTGKRVVEFVAKQLGECEIYLKYWQEWNGDDSIDDRFNITLVIEEEED